MSEQTPEHFTDEDTPDAQAAMEQADGNAMDPDRNPLSDASEPDIPEEELPEQLSEMTAVEDPDQGLAGT